MSGGLMPLYRSKSALWAARWREDIRPWFGRRLTNFVDVLLFCAAVLGALWVAVKVLP